MSRKQEDLVQKTIITQIKNSFYKRGLEIIIDRELQLLDDKRLDIVISYGFVGRVVIELKRLDNSDIEPRNIDDYLMKLDQYRKGIESEFVLFLIVKINNKLIKLKKKTDEIIQAVEKNELNGIRVIGLDGVLK